MGWPPKTQTVHGFLFKDFSCCSDLHYIICSHKQTNLTTQTCCLIALPGTQTVPACADELCLSFANANALSSKFPCFIFIWRCSVDSYTIVTFLFSLYSVSRCLKAHCYFMNQAWCINVQQSRELCFSLNIYFCSSLQLTKKHDQSNECWHAYWKRVHWLVL